MVVHIFIVIKVHIEHCKCCLLYFVYCIKINTQVCIVNFTCNRVK